MSRAADTRTALLAHLRTQTARPVLTVAPYRGQLREAALKAGRLTAKLPALYVLLDQADVTRHLGTHMASVLCVWQDRNRREEAAEADALTLASDIADWLSTHSTWADAASVYTVRMDVQPIRLQLLLAAESLSCYAVTFALDQTPA